MTRRITFVTGNPKKMTDASQIAEKFGIGVDCVELDINEIQHSDPLEITKHKAKEAYQKLGRAAVVNDSTWSIPALNGFPGGYMKDVTGWLSAEDFLALMEGKSDRSIALTEVVGHYDGQLYRSFVAKRLGQFVMSPRGNSDPSFAKVVKMDGDDGTISETLDDPNRQVKPENYDHWRHFFSWFAKQPLDKN